MQKKYLIMPPYLVQDLIVLASSAIEAAQQEITFKVESQYPSHSGDYNYNLVEMFVDEEFVGAIDIAVPSHLYAEEVDEFIWSVITEEFVEAL